LSNFNSADEINKNLKILDDYINSDPRLTKHRSLLQSSIITVNFERLIEMTKGTREIHYIDYNGSQIPMRLLSIKEEREIKHATHVLFKKYPEFIGGENNPEFSRIQLVKLLSKATSAAPEITECYLTENDVEALPYPAFNYLSIQYKKLESEYNIVYNPNLEDDFNQILMEIFDGEPLNEKKLTLLHGLSSSQLLQITIRLCNALIRLEDSSQFITSLEELNQNEPSELKDN